MRWVYFTVTRPLPFPGLRSLGFFKRLVAIPFEKRFPVRTAA